MRKTLLYFVTQIFFAAPLCTFILLLLRVMMLYVVIQCCFQSFCFLLFCDAVAFKFVEESNDQQKTQYYYVTPQI